MKRSEVRCVEELLARLERFRISGSEKTLIHHGDA